MKSFKFNQSGFTLIEMLVAIAIAGILTGGMYKLYRTNQIAQVTQDTIVDMQQNLRASMMVMEKEIRLAGLDPTGLAEAEILLADTGELIFQLDVNENGDLDAGEAEQIRYALTNDKDGDGIADGAPCHLGREVWGGGLVTVGYNIEALNFVYIDGDGNRLAAPVGSPENIRAIQVTMVARSGEQLEALSMRSTAAEVYANQQGEVLMDTPKDGFYRMLLSSEVKCRNIGIE